MTNEDRIRSIRKFMEAFPYAGSPSVLNAVIWYLERDRLADAQDKVQFDSDKFPEREQVVSFLDSIGLVSDSYRNILNRWK